MVLATFTPPTFDRADSPGWKAHLESEGYAVIHNVFTPEVVAQSHELFWKDWTTVSPGFVRNDPSTWSINTAPMMFAKGIAVFNGFGQSDFMWNLRLRPEILDIFAQIHAVPPETLISSFDGFSVFFSKLQKNPHTWWHVDQHPSNPNYSIQGAYNYLPVTENSAGFTVVPKSHNTFVASKTSKIEDWIEIHKNKTAEEASSILTAGVKLLLPPNCFVLWNSKTIHANTGIPCTKGSRKDDPPVLNRLTAYITYVPRTRTSVETTERRKQAYYEGATTSHWPEKLEIKKYPWGFGPRYESKGFKQITPSLTSTGSIPEERLKHI